MNLSMTDIHCNGTFRFEEGDTVVMVDMDFNYPEQCREPMWFVREWVEYMEGKHRWSIVEAFDYDEVGSLEKALKFAAKRVMEASHEPCE